MFSYDQLIVIAFYDSLKLGYYPLTLFYSVPDYIFDVKKLMLSVSFNCTVCIQSKISNAIKINCLDESLPHIQLTYTIYL